MRDRVVHVQWIPRKANPSDGLTHISSEFDGHMAQLRQTFTATDPRVQILAEGGVGILPSLQYLPSSSCLRTGLFTIDVRSFGSRQKVSARTAFVH